MKIAIIGSGLIGRSWSIVFTLGGHEVRLFDPDTRALDAAERLVGQALEELERVGLYGREEAAQAKGRVHIARTLNEAVADAEYVQESTPEKLSIKQQVFSDLDQAANDKCVLASSTSGFPASSFTSDLKARERCLVAHPVNPPHLIPLVELVPAPWTRPGVVGQVKDLMSGVGQSPIILQREVRGFVLNRLQGALLNEAFRLVDDEICSATEVDAAVRDGLARRWVFMGPMETIDLNAPGGVSDYCERYGALYREMAEERREPVQWSNSLIDKVEQDVARRVAGREREERSALRDRRLAQVAQFMGQLK